MFWRFSVPTITAWRPLGSAWAPQARSGTFVNSSPSWVARRWTKATSSAAACRSAVDGARKWTWVSAASQPSARRSTGRSIAISTSRRPGPTDEPAADRSMIEALDDLDLDRADRQVDPERARHVGVGVRAQDHAGARVLEDRRVDLLAVPERRQVAAVLGDEPDPGRRRLVGHGQPDVDPDIGRRQWSDADATAGSVRTRVEVGDPDVPAVDADPGVRRRGDVDDDARRFGPARGLGSRLRVHPRSARPSRSDRRTRPDRTVAGVGVIRSRSRDRPAGDRPCHPRSTAGDGARRRAGRPCRRTR